MSTLYIKFITLIFLSMLSFSHISANTLEKEKLPAVLSIITGFVLTNNTLSMPNNEVVDISLQPLNVVYQSYTVMIYSDTPAPTEYAKESLAIYGTINSGDTVILEVNNLYPKDTKFLLIIKNSSDEQVAESTILNYDSGLSSIDFGNIITSKQ